MRRVSGVCVLFARMDGWLPEEVRTEVRTNEQRRTQKMRGTSSPVCMRAFNMRTGLLSHYTFRECLYSLLIRGRIKQPMQQVCCNRTLAIHTPITP